MEEWRPVVGFEGLYEVSSEGRVRSLPRICPTRWGTLKERPGRMLAPYLTSVGYLRVTLSKSDGKRGGYPVDVHAAVAASFIGKRPDGMSVDHRDRNQTNNKVANLRYADRSQQSCNRRVRRISRTGLKGVSIRSSGFGAEITARGRSRWLGTFDTKEEAANAYKAAATILHGEFMSV